MQLTRNAPTMPTNMMTKKKVLLSIMSCIHPHLSSVGEGHTLRSVNRVAASIAKDTGCAGSIDNALDLACLLRLVLVGH